MSNSRHTLRNITGQDVSPLPPRPFERLATFFRQPPREGHDLSRRLPSTDIGLDCANIDRMIHGHNVLETEHDVRNLPSDAEVQLIVSSDFAIKWRLSRTAYFPAAARLARPSSLRHGDFTTKLFRSSDHDPYDRTLEFMAHITANLRPANENIQSLVVRDHLVTKSSFPFSYAVLLSRNDAGDVIRASFVETRNVNVSPLSVGPPLLATQALLQRGLPWEIREGRINADFHRERWAYYVLHWERPVGGTLGAALPRTGPEASRDANRLIARMWEMICSYRDVKSGMVFCSGRDHSTLSYRACSCPPREGV